MNKLVSIGIALGLATGIACLFMGIALGTNSLRNQADANPYIFGLVFLFLIFVATISIGSYKAIRARARRAIVWPILAIILFATQVSLIRIGYLTGSTKLESERISKRETQIKLISNGEKSENLNIAEQNEYCQAFNTYASSIFDQQETNQLLSREKSLKKFTVMLNSKDSALLNCAIEAVGRFGSKARSAVPKLVELIEDTHNEKALSALAQIDSAQHDKLSKSIESGKTQKELAETADARVTYAKGLRQDLIKKYLNISVSTSGKYNTTLTLSGIYFDEAVVQAMEDVFISKDNIIREGFKRLVYSSVDGQVFQYNWD